MSLILDALSRAEREKRSRSGAVPDRFAQVETGRVPPGRLQRWGLPVALSVALLIIAALLLSDDLGFTPESERQLRPANPAPQAAQAQVPGKVQPGAVQPPGGSSSETAREPGADSSAAKEAEAIEALYARGRSGYGDPAPSQAGASPSPSASAADSAVAGDPAAAAQNGSAQPQSPQQARTVSEEPLDIEQVLREVRAEAARDPLAPHPAPLLSSLSKRFRDSVPTLMYLRHDYNAQGQSSVLINGEQLREGGRSRAVEVREILPDSVILRFAEQDFRLRSLNSWVNL